MNYDDYAYSKNFKYTKNGLKKTIKIKEEQLENDLFWLNDTLATYSFVFDKSLKHLRIMSDDFKDIIDVCETVKEVVDELIYLKENY
jgi:hypothetical protein